MDIYGSGSNLVFFKLRSIHSVKVKKNGFKYFSETYFTSYNYYKNFSFTVDNSKKVNMLVESDFGCLTSSQTKPYPIEIGRWNMERVWEVRGLCETIFLLKFSYNKN